MALESPSSNIHPTSDNSKLYNSARSEDYNTQSVELADFAPFGNILNATDGSTKQPIPSRGDRQDDTVFTSDHPPVSSETAVVDSFPDGGARSWLVVMGSFFLLMASYGMMNSVGVFQSYLETNQLSSYSSTDVGWISSSFVFVALLLGVYIGPLFDSHGPKVLVYGGSVIFMLSLFLFAECKQYWQFLLSFGILGGIGAALVSTVAMACVPHWFEIRAGMAIGTALAGSGLGGIPAGEHPNHRRIDAKRWTKSNDHMVRVITVVGIMPSGLDEMDLLGIYLEMESEGLKSSHCKAGLGYEEKSSNIRRYLAF
ncbi:hypothetical protein EIK77_000245 [Talaromyces pinophilus]|nr:hypothetical protein EIK77_000245 [Talaromyces pinophilus]